MTKHTPLLYQRLAGPLQEHPQAFHDAFGCSTVYDIFARRIITNLLGLWLVSLIFSKEVA